MEAPTLTDQTYIVGGSDLVYTLPAFTFGASCTGGTITYTVREDTTDTAFNSALLVYSSGNHEITVSTTDLYVDVYEVEVFATATVSGSSQTASAVFTLTVTNNCPFAATISSVAVAPDYF